MHNTEVVVEDDAQRAIAIEFATKHKLKLVEDVTNDGVYLCFTEDGIEVRLHEQGIRIALALNYASGSTAHRRLYGGGKGQLIAKAIGLSKGFKPKVLDATAGLGRDAFVMATLGAQVTLNERSPVVHLLLSDALSRAKLHGSRHNDGALVDIIERMNVSHFDSAELFKKELADVEVIYLDPMFPERKKSALVKKEMRIFHHIVGEDQDADALLAPALRSAIYRVVVKRPKVAPYLDNMKPTYQLIGKSSRFDIYTKKAFPI